MSARYTALPNPGPGHNIHHDQEGEIEAAFDFSEDDDDEHNITESHPLNPASTSPVRAPLAPAHQHIPGTYDFENVDYDYPPPGSPPRPSAIALPNDHGNSNGLIPSFNLDSTSGPHRNWFSRTAAAVLPSHYVQRLGLAPQRPVGVIGGGTNNDGVFANVTAKPAPPVTIQDGDESFVVPEDTRAEAPPSYASAQADAVPPYWETTIHAPFAPGAIGEMIVDSLPTGSLFSFLWNMLVSISFQFVGFLLTYLLHTTHAARLGSRAGLGVTLIQYGFALRGRMDPNYSGDSDSGWGSKWGSESPRPAMAEGEGATMHGHHHGNLTMYGPADGTAEEQANMMIADATTEWLSFFLMTVGWFILLTSMLGFWRVKRWERGIYASQRDASSSTPSEDVGSVGLFSRLEQRFSLQGISRADLFRQGFGFGRSSNRASDDEGGHLAARAEEGGIRNHDEDSLETTAMLNVDPNDPNRRHLIAAALANERRLQTDLRNAGLL